MTQRIVIKTSVNKAPTANASVSYQWHWRRIFMAFSVVLLFATALIYGLMNSVNADEIQTTDRGSIQSEVIIEADDEAEHKQVVTPKKSAPAPVINVAEVTVDNPAAVIINDEERLSSSVQNQVDMQSETPSDVVEQVVDEEQSEQLSENTFSEHAAITNVALGAQIDSNLVSRAVLTTGVVDREPIDVLKENLELTQFVDKLFFFTEINNMQGQTVQHLWFHQDQLMAEIPLSISAIRFRTYSSKNIMPSQTGQWRVEVVTDQGQLLAQKSFRIISEAE
ncbi:DUF2914 domain-containing protein [Pseudoalteromonas sp. JBTF-M23]|uniref:DUF2914 domain-containing protein n=1 Tax=Pseudoalteromonas caenipelagi TaxID=2726988 RepID=A0A849VHV9_9GAMM|nr:DUF2914 domain-containing protein [Pseudoalteromonas caenipelagi]NOU52982.1 DUF2914 domain-containing protein [Pseudoalteromonas caenipelagi]